MNEASQVIYVEGTKHDVAWAWIQDIGMNEATVVIFAGLLAALASVAAWKESGGGAPAGLRWSPTESWVTTSAVILAWVMTAYADPATGGDSLSGGLIGDNDLDGFFDPGTSRAPLVFGLDFGVVPAYTPGPVRRRPFHPPGFRDNGRGGGMGGFQRDHHQFFSHCRPSGRLPPAPPPATAGRADRGRAGRLHQHRPLPSRRRLPRRPLDPPLTRSFCHTPSLP